MKPVDFAFILHPLSQEDIFRKFGFMRNWPTPLINATLRMLPPVFTSYITGINSPHANVEGCFIGVPFTSEQMLQLPLRATLGKIVSAGKKAAKMGARIVGLGAMTAVVGDAGVTVANKLDIAVTTGNSYTVATALEGVEKAAELMGMDISRAEVAVLGATGSIGNVCARILARKADHLTLIARKPERLRELADSIMEESGVAARETSKVKEAVRKADIIVSVSSSAEFLIEPEDLKPGAIVCDVARPRDVSTKVADKRDDVLVIEGGVVEVPGDVNFNFNFGFPPQTAYACMAETMILALEKRFENFSLGRHLELEKIDEISSLAKKHGFKLAGFRSFERALSEDAIENIRRKAAVKRGEFSFNLA